MHGAKAVVVLGNDTREYYPISMLPVSAWDRGRVVGGGGGGESLLSAYHLISPSRFNFGTMCVCVCVYIDRALRTVPDTRDNTPDLSHCQEGYDTIPNVYVMLRYGLAILKLFNEADDSSEWSGSVNATLSLDGECKRWWR